MTELTDGNRAVRRACIERTLADYPEIEKEDLAEVLHWFRKEASALDVALLASSQDIADAYRRLRADHLDRMTLGDVTRATLFVAASAAVIVLIALLAL